MEIAGVGVDRGGIGGCPDGNAIIESAKELEGAQEVLRSVVDACVAAARRDRRRLHAVRDAFGERPALQDVLRIGSASCFHRQLIDRVDLGAIEASLEQRELVGRDPERVCVGADERLVSEARTARVGRCAVRAVVGDVDIVQIETSEWVRAGADRNEHARVREIPSSRRIQIDLQLGDEPAIRLPVEIHSRIGQERAVGTDRPHEL